MAKHSNTTGNSIHVIHAFTFVDAIARNAATVISTDIGKVAKQSDNDSYHILIDTTPTWSQLDSSGFDTFLEMTDTPSSYAGNAGKVAEVNTGETALQFGQKLRTTDSPQFADLTLTGDLTVQGTTTTLDTTTLLVEDKNVELGNVSTPTDVTADGGGITLKGTTNKTINWLNSTNAWSFNQNIDLLGNNLLTSGGNVLAGSGLISVGNFLLTGNVISTTSGDLDITTSTGGVFKYTSNAFQAGQDASNFLEIGHGGSNAFINQVGAGEMDFRFAGVNKASFTPAGHLHLKTDTDQKHNLKIITANNLNDSGIAWENSGGNFSQTIFRTDVGSNRSDLVFAIGSNANIDLLTDSFKIHGSAVNEGRLEILSTLQISSGNPGVDKFLKSDANGVTSWSLPSGGGWTDSGVNVFLTTVTDKVGIGEAGPDSKLHVVDASTAGAVTATANSIATFEKGTNGFISVLTPDANEKGIIFGGPVSNLDGGIIYNTGGLRGMEFRVNGNSPKMFITSAGDVGVGSSSPNARLEVRGPLAGNIGGFSSGMLHVTSNSASQFANAVITGHNLFSTNTQLWYLGSASSSNDNVAFINRQNGQMFFSTNNTSRLTIEADGRVGIGLSGGTEKLEVAGNIKTTGYIDFGLLTSVSNVEGRVFYNTDNKALELKTDIVGSTQSLGQEFWVRVINKTGVSVPDGSVVFVDGFDVTSGRPTIALAKADVIETSNALGFTTNTMTNNSEGFVTTMGFLNDLDTSSFTAGDELFLSDTTAGAVTATKPLIAVSVGFATQINASTGQILTTIARKETDSPIFAQLSDSVNQKPTVTTPVSVKFNINDDVRGITHSASSATEDIIIDFDGTYTIIAQPQVEKTSGGGTVSYHMWIRIGTDDKGGVIAITVQNPSQIVTDAAHGLSTGQTVEITNVGTTPDINGQHVVTVINPTTFSIPVNVTAVSDDIGDWRRILDVNDDLSNSNVELNLTGATDSSVIPVIVTKDLVKGEKVNIMQSVSATGFGVGLVAITPSGEPLIPSIIFAMNKN